ncbi:MAG TPA: DUF1549 and DUF1553 domain-containing protein [Chthonomonadaceae bacterium]|nr:DUF1549 and DUF1553 domain-containing protein [Chthonomonadaceae bacterium]
MITRGLLRVMGGLMLGVLASCSAGADSVKSPAQKPISFVNSVIPVLTRAGCNQGACHGAAAGKNGFKLSLRGFAPELDYVALTRQVRGRRIDLVEPEKSLILRKGLMELPHLGGKVLQKGTPEYDILLKWLTQGAPGPDPNDPHVTGIRVSQPVQSLAPKAQVQLHVQALFSDGSSRDVTHWARFATNDENVATVVPNGMVTIAGVGQTAIMVGYQDRVSVARVLVPFPNRVDPKTYARLPRANYIDDRIYSKLASLRLPVSHPATDLEYIRRVTLDLTGALPTPVEARAFAANTDPKKREKLVDALMAKPEFIDFWTYKWSDMLRVNRGTLKDKGMWAYYSYIHDAVRDNKPWDAMSREILTAKGNTFLDGPANYFRTALKPEELAENVSQGFLGIRMQCAKCHNHPLEKWTQNEYYGMANIFARVKFKADLGIYVNDEMTVYNAASGDLIQPRLGQPVPPKPLGGPVLASNTHIDRRVAFAEWLTRPDNWYFSHSIVNRVWAHFMGRGLVEPVDDLRETNPASNPELFDALADDFVKHGFDLRHLMRQIITSQAYQLSSAPTPENARDDRYYSHFLVRRMTAEELLDALSQVSGKPEEFPGMPPGLRAVQLPDTHVKSDFMDTLGRPPRVITCECERSQEPNMAQALLFINGELINRKMTADDGLVDRLVKAGKSDTEILDEIYWATVGRAPRPAERDSDLAALHKALTAIPVPATTSNAPAPDPKAQNNQARRRVFEDMLWVLVNSKEFLFNH